MGHRDGRERIVVLPSQSEDGILATMMSSDTVSTLMQLRLGWQHLPLATMKL